MSNSTNTNWLIKLNSDAEMVDLVQSSVSLVITIMIFIKVFDFAGLKKSIRDKRDRIKREKEKKRFRNDEEIICCLSKWR